MNKWEFKLHCLQILSTFEEQRKHLHSEIKTSSYDFFLHNTHSPAKNSLHFSSCCKKSKNFMVYNCHRCDPETVEKYCFKCCEKSNEKDEEEIYALCENCAICYDYIHVTRLFISQKEGGWQGMKYDCKYCRCCCGNGNCIIGSLCCCIKGIEEEERKKKKKKLKIKKTFFLFLYFKK